MFVMGFFLTILVFFPCRTVALEEKTLEVDGIVFSFPQKLTQGELSLLRIKSKKEIKVEGKFLGRRLQFFKTNDGEWRALLFACLFDKPADASLSLKVTHEKKVFSIKERIKIVEGDFGVEHLRLPEVTLDKKTIARIKREKKALDGIWKEVKEERYWRGSFILPTKGEFGSSFGVRRIINNKPRSPHTGIDIKAPYGREVPASNHGKVRFIGDLFFAGKSLIIDHGMGVYTMYFHLSKVLVKLGEKVKKGEIVALVGSTGRATEPHLHFGVRVQGARINPHSLFSLPDE
jgi:hypothetical protein